MKKLTKRPAITEYIYITIGSLITAFGISVFLIDAHVVPGGVTGVAMAIHYLSKNTISVGLVIWLLNIPLYLWGIKELGKGFGAKTFWGFTSNSIFIDMFRGQLPGLSMINFTGYEFVKDLKHNDFFFMVLLGSVMLGLGLGIIFKFKGTTGGSDIIAAILHKKFGIKQGQALIFTDFFVIIFAGVVIYNTNTITVRPAITITLYALFFLFVTTKIIDVIIDGFDYAKMVIIFSEKNKDIEDLIINELSRGGTGVKSRGLYNNDDKEYIMTVLPTKEISEFIYSVKILDPKAFVIVNDVHEVLGEGFRKRI